MQIDNMPTISRSEAKRRGMRAIEMPTISRSEADRLGMKPLSTKFDGLGARAIQSNNQEEEPHVWKQDMYRDTTIGDYGQAFGQGVGEGVGKLVDTAAAAGNLINTGAGKTGAYVANKVGATDTAEDLNKFADKSYEDAKDLWKNPHVEKVASDVLDTGLNHDKGIRAARAAGEFVGTMPAFGGVGKGVQVITKAGKLHNVKSIQQINKILDVPLTKTNALSFAAMGAGGELAKSDKPETSATENVIREVVGSIFAGVTVPMAMRGVASKVANVFTGASKNTAGKLTRSEKTFIKKYSGKLDKDIIDKAKKLNLPLAVDIISNSPRAQGLMKNTLDSALVDQSFVEAKKAFSPRIVEALEKNIYDKIGSEIKGDASDIAHSYIKNTFEANQQNSRQLYDNAKSLLKNEVIQPSQSINSATELVKELSYGSKVADSGGKSQVINRLSEFIEASKNGLEVRDLLGWKRDLANVGSEQLSYKSLLKGISSKIDSEISNMVKSGTIKDNKSFVDAWKTATEYNKKNVQELKKIKIVRDLIQDKFPKDIMDLMKNKQGLSEMETLLKDNKELWQSLKRVRLSETLLKKNVINAKGEVSASNFINFLAKDKDYAISLMGKEQHALMEKYFLPYFQKLENLGRSINFSNTGKSIKDSALEESASNMFGRKMFIASGIGASAAKYSGVSGGLAGAGVGAIASIGKTALAKNEIRSIANLSKIASDEKMLKEMIKYMEKQVPLNERISNFTKSITKENINKAAKKGVQKLSDNPILQRQVILMSGDEGFEESLKEFENSDFLKFYNKNIGGDKMSRDKYYK